MDLSAEDVGALGVALNESDIVGIEIDAEARWASVTLAVLTLLSDDDPMPEDRRVQLVLQPIGRVAASHRLGRWDDAKAEISPVAIDDLSAVVASFGQQSIYGWEFFDVPEEKDFNRWADRLSLDWTSAASDGRSHTLNLFQEGATKNEHIDMRFWFDELRILGPDHQEIPLEIFTSGGARWWDAMYAGDERAGGVGIVPGAPAQSTTSRSWTERIVTASRRLFRGGNRK